MSTKLPFSLFMASNNNSTLLDPLHSSGQSLIPRRKHRSSAVAVALRRRGAHKRHSGNSSPVNFRQGFMKSELSARKLAAGLWQLRFLEASADGGADIGDGSVRSHTHTCQYLDNGNIKVTFPHCKNSEEKFKETKDQLRRPVTILRSRNGLRCELETSMPRIKCSKEEATKWNPALNEASNEPTTIHSRKLLEFRKLVGDRDSVVTALLEELLRAQRSINKLKAAQKSSRKKVKQFLQNLEEQKVLWKLRERQKIEAMLDGLKDKLARERRSRERMEVLNTKLVHELAEANKSAKQFVTNYEKEKKERELIEEVCNELAMQIGEDKAKLEGLMREKMKIFEEVEEERKMMQMAELWREDRVQMKLTDAKLVLEDKYNQMVQLIAYLQMFLRSRGAEVDTTEMEDAELIKLAVESVNIQRLVELSYDFSSSDDIHPVYEELREDNAGERMIKLNSPPTLTGPLSIIHIESLDEEWLIKNSMLLHQSSPFNDHNNAGLEQTNSSGTVSVGHIEDHKFSSSPQWGDTCLSLINVKQDNNNILGSEAECSEKADTESVETGVIVNGVCSVSAAQSKWKASKQPRSSCPNDETTISHTKSSQHRRPVQTGGTNSSPLCNKGSVEGRFKHMELLRQGNSTDNMNPHIARGMKGCIEWPRGIPKTNSKVIPLEERVKSQKSQLQHILKPKAY